jgi:hypothetical protein
VPLLAGHLRQGVTVAVDLPVYGRYVLLR